MSETCLAPLYDSETKVLILGTFPGKQSSKTNDYYVNSGNLFWKLIEHHLNDDKKIPEQERYTFLKERHIGLWDVCCACDRNCSLDCDIKNATFNDFSDIKKRCPQLIKIVLNGSDTNKIYRAFCRRYKELTDIIEYVPSSSRSNRMPKHEIMERWSVIKLD